MVYAINKYVKIYTFPKMNAIHILSCLLTHDCYSVQDIYQKFISSYNIGMKNSWRQNATTQIYVSMPEQNIQIQPIQKLLEVCYKDLKISCFLLTVLVYINIIFDNSTFYCQNEEWSFRKIIKFVGDFYE